jgi:HEAT repeat protein
MPDEGFSTGREPSLSSSSRLGLTGQEPSLGGEQNLTWHKIHAALDGLQVDAHSRELAAQAMRRQSRDPQAVPALVEMLRREDGHLKMSIARVLGEIGDAAALPGLVEALQDAHSYVRSSAAWALGAIGHGYAVPYLRETLEGDSNGVVLAAVLWSLRQIGDRQAVGAIQAALHHSDRFVRRGAVIAMGELKHIPAVATLRTMLSDVSEDVRMAAAEALARIDAYQALNALEQQENQQGTM